MPNGTFNVEKFVKSYDESFQDSLFMLEVDSFGCLSDSDRATMMKKKKQKKRKGENKC